MTPHADKLGVEADRVAGEETAGHTGRTTDPTPDDRPTGDALLDRLQHAAAMEVTPTVTLLEELVGRIDSLTDAEAHEALYFLAGYAPAATGQAVIRQLALRPSG
jgi:hypothetical protein